MGMGMMEGRIACFHERDVRKNKIRLALEMGFVIWLRHG